MTERATDHRVWMLVEDDSTLRMLITTFMSDLWGLEPLVFSDGFQVMQWLDEVEADPDHPLPEIALLDQRLPGPGGAEIARRMRDMEATHNMPLVLLTAARMDPREEMEIQRMAEPDHMLTKPLPAPDDLKALLDDIIAERQASHGG